ncbi:hypothetical protein JW960_19205 [candidate division KSB1 bacterium]|nr:hypothetical protein [candidate division KSB1 bacterium]
MIDGISSTGLQAMNMQFAANQNAQLTDDQKDQLQEILSNYDPANMSDDEKKSLMEALKSSGIGPSKEVRTIIEDAGFKLGKPPAGPPPGGNGMGGAKPPFMQEAINKYESEGLTDQDIDDLISQLKKWGGSQQGVLIDQTT